MRVAVSGASGLIGRALCPHLEQAGHDVWRLVRRAADPRANEIRWSIADRRIDADGLAGADAVVHLAGENIAAGRWTEKQKARIRESRVAGTRLIAETIAGLAQPPRALLCASGINVYGDRGDDVLDESAPVGEGFLPEVCQAWEHAALPAAEAGVRVVHLRTGMVLSRRGGALAKLLTPFRLGLGGVIGSGRQYISWISLHDHVRVIEFALQLESLSGPVNAASPNPVTNREFTRTLGRTLHRPTPIPLPAVAVVAAFGEMGRHLLLASCRAVPKRLLDQGFRFDTPELDTALERELR